MKRKVFATYTGWLILINVIAFLAFLILLNIYGENIVSLVALQPSSIFVGKNLWTFVTSMFMHANITHLFVNMLSLLFIGSFVERLIGKKRFIGLYLVAGLFAGIVFVLLAGFFGSSGGILERIFGSPMAFAVGASGAIFGLGGLLAVLTPRLKVLVFFIIPMPMWIAMVGLLVVFWVLSLATPLGIGNTAHFGGLLVGVIYGFYLKKKYPHKTKMIARYFSR